MNRKDHRTVLSLVTVSLIIAANGSAQSERVIAADPSGSWSISIPVNLTPAVVRYPWKLGIVTTIFWIGEHSGKNNPVSNTRSAWDRDWYIRYGGYDNPDPASRKNFLPLNLVPHQNPFYAALPYNDIDGNRTKAEASQVIPWFRQSFVGAGRTVLKSRWLAIRHGSRVCYAQWEDCGPFRTDDWQYVFGNGRPKPNLNQGAGLDVSPAVRDYLRLRSKDVSDWKFVDFVDIPPGPWTFYGDNNSFVILNRARHPLSDGHQPKVSYASTSR